jgi:hypothetical protein
MEDEPSPGERKFIRARIRRAAIPFGVFDLEMTDLMQFYDSGPCAGR